MKQLALILTTIIPALALSAQLDLESIRQKYNLPALGYTLIRNGSYSSNVTGVRKFGTDTVARVDDKFHLGSCTKAMTATILAIFVERNLLRWDSKLVDLFPELESKMDPAFKSVPIGWLPAMHSGIAANFTPELNGIIWNPKLDPSEGRKIVAQKILTAPPTDPPGTKFVYSNTNYVIVGRVLEKLSGKSWEDLMRDEIFKPLNMASCGFGPQADPKIDPPNQPWPHILYQGQPIPITPGFKADNPPTVGPAGTVHCNMEDWTKFLQVHLDGANGKDTPILKATSFSKLHELYSDKTFTYGGWTRVDLPDRFALSYVGSNTMNLAEVWLFPKSNLTALAVTNAGGGTLAGTKDDSAYKATEEVIANLLKP